ncbi:MAG TPA: hypothetical protein VMT18_03240, partial [Planctomycetota bacterium]|nr:hypothetical protein [Planctomycetota bacterium]
MRVPFRALRRVALPAALALSLAGCAQFEERPEPVSADVCAAFERWVDEAREGLAAGRLDEVLVLLEGLPPTPPAGQGDPRERSLLLKLHMLAD